MSTNTSTKGQTGARTRLLAYGLFAYRLGWGALMNKTPMLVKVGGLLLLGAVLVLGLVAGVIGLFALAIHVARAFKQMPDQTAPPKKVR